MKLSLIGLMRKAGLFMRSTALITALSFAMLVTSPAAMALRVATDTRPAQTADSGAEARLSALLEQITERFDALEAAHEAGQATDAIISELDALQEQMIALDNEVMANFMEMEQRLKDKNLPETILKRHQDMVAHYQAHRARLIEQFEDMDMSHWRWLLGQWWDRLLVWLGVDIQVVVDSPIKDVDPRQFRRSHQAFDPGNLPNKSMRPDAGNMPKRTKQDYRQASLFNSPVNALANLGDFTYDALAGASDPAYLAETDEVILTQRIKDQAQALNHDPVTIYHWVRNNVEWQPSWGAVQDAELTLDARRGNAMDIASLTIALLRASQIPARYVHGTIEVPEARFRNWAGGFTSIDAAVDFAASGGIPTAASVNGGRIARVELEHVWVEAAIDYFPSRGASNRHADAWVQMDPGYKQYAYLEGLDAVQISGIDTNQLASAFLASGTVNEAEGWVQGFDPAILENAQAQAQAALEHHINTNMTNPALHDVIGGRKTIVQEHPVLPSSLPNRILVEGARYDKLPSQLQQEVTYTLGVDQYRQPYKPTTFAWSTLNNEKVTLSFRPATPDDEAALRSLLPEGQITDASQLPQSIPSYLIEVVPELRVNAELRIAGLPMKLGEELVFSTSIRFPGRTTKEDYKYKVIAGSYLSVNAVAGSISVNRIEDLGKTMSKTMALADLHQDQVRDFVSREDVMGDIFRYTSFIYFAHYLSLARVLDTDYQSVGNLAAGYGVIGYVPKVSYIFGFPSMISAGHIVLDIPLSISNGSLSGNSTIKVQHTLNLGILSSCLEHLVPEMLFGGDGLESLEYISAVKGLSKANDAGQKIELIDSRNIDSILSILTLDESLVREITSAAQAGYSVILHGKPVKTPQFTGIGYIILDPETGGGAYKISGGDNGGIGEAFAASSPLAVGSTGLLFASAQTAIGGNSIYAGDLKLLGKLTGGFGALISGVKLLVDLWNSDCTSALAKVLILATFVLAAYAVAALIPTIAAFVATAGSLASSALPALLLSLFASFQIDRVIAKARTISGC